MTSKTQKLRGYPLPEVIRPDDTISFCVTIPNDPAFYEALRGQLTDLGKWWFWKRDSDTFTKATQTAMTWREMYVLTEGCGEMSIDYDALKASIKGGIYDAVNDVAKQIVSGRTINISVDDAGGVSDPTTSVGQSDAGLPEDDPLTLIDETEAARYGAMVEIANKLELVLDKIDTYYGVDATPDNTEQDAQDGMNIYFDADETKMSAAVTSYYSWRIVPNNQIGFNGGTTLPQYLYCNGYSLDALGRYLNDVAAYSVSKQKIINYFWASLNPTFFSHYFDLGVVKPSNAYLDAACVPMPYQEFLDVPYASARNLSPSPAKGGHRLKIKVFGYYTDPDGDLQDAFWYRTAGGTLTRSNFTFSHGAGSNMPSDNQVPYRTDHIYEYTIDLASVTSSWSVTFNKNAGMAAGSTSPTNGFSIQITDEGQAVSS